MTKDVVISVRGLQVMDNESAEDIETVQQGEYFERNGSIFLLYDEYYEGFDGDLYGQELRLDFCAYLRPEKKFPSTRELHDRIAENIREAASLVSLTEWDGKTDK